MLAFPSFVFCAKQTSSMTRDAKPEPALPGLLQCLPTEEDCIVICSGVKSCKTHGAASDTVEAATAAGEVEGTEHVTATKVTKRKWRIKLCVSC